MLPKITFKILNQDRHLPSIIPLTSSDILATSMSTEKESPSLLTCQRVKDEKFVRRQQQVDMKTDKSIEERNIFVRSKWPEFNTGDNDDAHINQSHS